MSAYGVDEICWRVVHDAEFLTAMCSDPAVAVASADLTAEERAALLAGEVGRLYELGGHPFMLQQLANNGVLGLTPERYSERMRAVAPVDPLLRPGY